MYLDAFQKTNFDRLWDDLRRVQTALGEDFFPMGISEKRQFPAINIREDAEGANVQAQLPGIEPEEIEVSVTGDLLSISGERKLENWDEKNTIHRQERWSGKFSRTIRLPFTIDAKNIKASSKNGILNIRLPRVEEEKPKKIAIKAE